MTILSCPRCCIRSRAHRLRGSILSRKGWLQIHIRPTYSHSNCGCCRHGKHGTVQKEDFHIRQWGPLCSSSSPLQLWAGEGLIPTKLAHPTLAEWPSPLTASAFIQLRPNSGSNGPAHAVSTCHFFPFQYSFCLHLEG